MGAIEKNPKRIIQKLKQLSDEELQYSKLEITEVEIIDIKQDEVVLKINVHNKTDVKVKEVVQIYIKDINSIYATFTPTLCSFRMVELDAMEQQTIEMKIAPQAFTIIDEKGDCYRDSNEFEIYISTAGIDNRSKTITGKDPIIKKIQFQSIVEELEM